METKILLTLCLMLLSATVKCQVPTTTLELNEKIKLQCPDYNTQQKEIEYKFCFNPTTYAVFQAGLNTQQFAQKSDPNLVAAYQSWCNCETQQQSILDNYRKCAQDWVNQTINTILTGNQPTCIPTLRPKTAQEIVDYQVKNGQCGNQVDSDAAWKQIRQRDCFNEQAEENVTLYTSPTVPFTKKEDVGFYFQMLCNCQPLGQKYEALDRYLACFKLPIDTAIQVLPTGVPPVCKASDSRPKNYKQLYESITQFCDPQFSILNQKISIKNCYNDIKWNEFVQSTVTLQNFISKQSLNEAYQVYCNCEPSSTDFFGTDQAVKDFLTCAKSKIDSTMQKYSGDQPSCTPSKRPRNNFQLYEQYQQCPDFQQQLQNYSDESCFNDLAQLQFLNSANSVTQSEYTIKDNLDWAFQVLCNCQPKQESVAFLTCYNEVTTRALGLITVGTAPTCRPTGRPRNSQQLLQLINQCSTNNEAITNLPKRDCFNEEKWNQFKSSPNVAFPNAQLTIAFQVYCNCQNLTEGFTALDDLLTCNKASVLQGLTLYNNGMIPNDCPNTFRPRNGKQLLESFYFCKNFETLNADLQQNNCFNEIEWDNFNNYVQASADFNVNSPDLIHVFQVYCNCQNTGVKANDDFLTCVKNKIIDKMAIIPISVPTCKATGRPRNSKQVLQQIQKCDNYAILNADLQTKDCFDEVQFNTLKNSADLIPQYKYQIKSEVIANQVYCNCNLTGVTANDNFLTCAKTVANMAIAYLLVGAPPTCLATGRPRNMKQLVGNLQQCTDYAILHFELQSKNCFNNEQYDSVLSQVNTSFTFSSKNMLDNVYQTYCNCKPRGLQANDALLKCIQDKINASISSQTAGDIPTCGPISRLGNLPTKIEVYTSLSSCSTNVSDFLNLLIEAARNNYCVNIQALNSMQQQFSVSEQQLNAPIEKKDDASLESVYQLYCNCNTTTANQTYNDLQNCFKPKVDAFIARIKEGKAPFCLYRRPSTLQVFNCLSTCGIQNGTEYIKKSSCVNQLQFIEFGEKMNDTNLNGSTSSLNEISTPIALNLKQTFCNCNGTSGSQADIFLKCQRACINPLDSDTEIGAQVCTKPPTSVFSMQQCASQTSCMNGTIEQYADTKLSGCLNKQQCDSVLPYDNAPISVFKQQLQDINQDQKKKLNNCFCNCAGMQNEQGIRDVYKCLMDACYQTLKTESCEALPVKQQEPRPSQGSYLYVELLLVLICLIY